MTRLEKLKIRLKRIKILLIVFPFVYGGIVLLIRKLSRKSKIVIIGISIISILFYGLLIKGCFDTQKEIYIIENITLTVEPARD